MVSFQRCNQFWITLFGPWKGFMRASFTHPGSNRPSSCASLTSPESFNYMKGPNQCICSFLGNFKNFLSYSKTCPPTMDFSLLCLSFHAFYLYFLTIWWKFSMNLASSSFESSSILFRIDSSSSIWVDCAMKRMGIVNSASSTTSYPYTSWKGVCLCKCLTVMRYSHRDFGTLSSQLSLLVNHISVKPFSNILLKASTMSISWGWYGLLLWCCIMKF